MLHLWLIQLCIRVGYYAASIGYPLFQTYNALNEKKRGTIWVKIITYWILYLFLAWFDHLFFFISGYICDCTENV